MYCLDYYVQMVAILPNMADFSLGETSCYNLEDIDKHGEVDLEEV
jgi:hypothetical protein